MGIQWVLNTGFKEVFRDFTKGGFSGVQTIDTTERGYTRITLYAVCP